MTALELKIERNKCIELAIEYVDAYAYATTFDGCLATRNASHRILTDLKKVY